MLYLISFRIYGPSKLTFVFFGMGPFLKKLKKKSGGPWNISRTRILVHEGWINEESDFQTDWENVFLDLIFCKNFRI